MTDSNEWDVSVTGKAIKQKEKLPPKIIKIFNVLMADLIQFGPELKHWQNYGQITGKKGFYHCHLNKGKPRYVAVWKVTDFEIKLMEIRYVGTHENADYRRIN
ncbi:MAG: cytotoxic translational repressor of toxin-antitoxin stability system [Oxalobacter sp.]|nr:cytotoxic translational repressor of toxin-antitoxin stability system [Oxalobacter sp.]